MSSAEQHQRCHVGADRAPTPCEICQNINRFNCCESVRVHNHIMTTNDTQDRDGIIGGALTVALLITLAVQNAVPPMATDMY